MTKMDMEMLRELCKAEGYVAVAETCLGMALEEYGGRDGGSCMVVAPVSFVKKKHREDAVARVFARAFLPAEGTEEEPEIDGALPVELIYGDAAFPDYQTPDAAGLDLSAHSVAGEEASSAAGMAVPPYSTVTVNTGVAVGIPAGHVGLVFARESLAARNGLRLAEGVGVIHGGPRRHVQLHLHNDGPETQILKEGTKVAQLVVLRCEHLVPVLAGEEEGLA